MKKVSILIPTIRPQRIPGLIRKIIDNAGVPEKMLEVLTVEDKERHGCPKTLKRLVSMASHDLVMFIGDDTDPQPGFVAEACRMMKKLPDRWGLVGLNDLYQDGNRLATHWLAHKKLLTPLGGEFFHTGYRHTWCDVELTERAKAIGRYRWAKKAIIKHEHPLVFKDKGLMDADYARVYSDEYQRHDRELYERRKANGWGKMSRPAAGRRTVAIGIPAAWDGRAKFWQCLEKMRYYSLTKGIDTVRKRRAGAVVHHARNLIVSDILKLYPQATHLFFTDDDQTFKEDILERMLAADKDILVCNIHRRYPPYIPVVSREMDDDDLFHPVYVRPSRGGLEQVTSGGTGVCLIKMDVFKKVPFPWFQSEYIQAPEGRENEPGLINGHLFVSEDNRFFLMARHHGYKIWCDFSIEVGHLAEHEVTWRDHERAMAEDGERNKSDNANAGAGDRRDGNQRDDQPRLAGWVPTAPGVAQFPVDGGLDDNNGGLGNQHVQLTG